MVCARSPFLLTASKLYHLYLREAYHILCQSVRFQPSFMGRTWSTTQSWLRWLKSSHLVCSKKAIKVLKCVQLRLDVITSRYWCQLKLDRSSLRSFGAMEPWFYWAIWARQGMDDARYTIFSLVRVDLPLNLWLGFAIRIATDMNFHRKSVAPLDGSPESLKLSQEIRNRERCWLWVGFVLANPCIDSSSALGYAMRLTGV